MKKLCKAMIFCCILALGFTGLALEAPAGPGGKDKVEKNAGGHGNQGDDDDVFSHALSENLISSVHWSISPCREAA